MKGWLGLALLVSGCGVVPGTACTEIGCVGGLTLAFTHAEPLQDGAWELQVTGQDGGAAVCAFTVTAGVVTSEDCEVSQTDDQVQFPFLQVDGDVNVLVELEGEEVLAEELSPEYEESRPNGPNCPPVCRSAAVEVAL